MPRDRERRREQCDVSTVRNEPEAAEDIKALVASLKDITAALAAADPTDKAKVYAEMGIELTSHHDGRVVVESRPRVAESSVGEPSGWRTTPTAPLVTSFSIS